MLRALFLASVVGLTGSASACTDSDESGPTEYADAAADTSTPDSEAGTCFETVAEHCAQNPCVTSWPSDQAAFCALGGGMLTLQAGCGPYDVAHFQGVDTATDHYYDPSTGELIAITHWNAGNWKTVCVAGPADFLATLATDAGDSSSCKSSPVDCQKASCGDAGDAACDSG